MSVSKRFSTFLENIKLTDTQKSNGAARRESVIRVLNKRYWNSESGTSNSSFVGSWGKHTRIRPPRDVDVLFELPRSVYDRFQQRSGNKQSQLLQEIKAELTSSFPNTAIRGDGPIVLVPFTAYNVELIPAFALQGGGHWICMTNNNGHYKKADYDAEIAAIAKSNTDTSNNTRDLVRMMKCWQANCNVPLKSFYIELLAVAFLSGWRNSGKPKSWYDFMSRDFFEYIVGRKNGNLVAPGTNEIMNIGEAWVSRAETALQRAKKACTHEAAEEWQLAGEEWQKIFGSDIPKVI